MDISRGGGGGSHFHDIDETHNNFQEGGEGGRGAKCPYKKV